MADASAKPPCCPEGEGTSQNQRLLAALDPDYARIDERGIRDWLQVAKALARELVYYDDDNHPAGDWTGFPNPEGLEGVAWNRWLEKAEAYAAQPEKFQSAEFDSFRRPHFALFLAFLKLLQQQQERLNGLTRRHLDFYYRDLLRQVPKPARPDRVHVLVDPAPGTSQALLPAGTLLNAGRNGQGHELHYRTARDLVFNRVQVARLSSVYTQRRVTGLGDVRLQSTGNKLDTLLEMLRLALGVPMAGDDPDDFKLGDQRLALSTDLLAWFDQFTLWLKGIFPDSWQFRRLLELKNARQSDPAGYWPRINRILERAGQARTNDSSFRISPGDRNFYGNVERALGKPDFNGLSQIGIQNLDDLYRQRDREGQAVTDFVKQSLHLTPSEFAELMAAKTRIDDDWREISQLLENAHPPGGGKFTGLGDPSTAEFKERWDFETLLKLSKPVYPATTKFPPVADLEAALTVLLDLESYFFMPLATFMRMMAACRSAMPWPSVPDIEWQAIEADLREARRKKFAPHSSPGDALSAQTRAEKVDWLCLSANADATSIRAASGTQPPRWRSFGQSGEQAAVPQTTLGLAMTSPILCLSEGARTIHLTLSVFCKPSDSDHLAEKLTSVFAATPPRFRLSAGNDWIEPACVGTPEVQSPNDPLLPVTVIWQLQLGPADPPVTAPSAESWPTLQLLLVPRQTADAERGSYQLDYPFLRTLNLARLELQVSVLGLANLRARNDAGEVDVTRPFEPFGPAPAAGSALTLSHPELAVKRISTVTVKLKWMGAPTDLSDHYQLYKDVIAAETKVIKTGETTQTISVCPFTASISLQDRGREILKNVSAALFAGVKNTDSADLNISASQNTGLANLPPEPDLRDGPAKESLTGKRTLRLELNAPDFQHAAYPALATAKAIDLANAIAANNRAKEPGKLDSKLYTVNPPYTPKLKSLQLDYDAALSIDMLEYHTGAAVDRIDHLHPFGQAEIAVDPARNGFPLFPAYDNAGELYIGLSGVEAPQSVAVLMQLAEGSANPDLQPAAVNWSFLSDNRWESLQNGGIVTDGTGGLIQSGVIQFQLPPALPSTLLQGGQYWLRASVAADCDSLCDTVGIHTQAVEASFVDRGDTPEHYATPLPANTIAKPVNAIGEVAAIRQPYTSFGGIPAEPPAVFNLRISERLRHKQRALSAWDYERLILERFPQIYRVNCLPAGTGWAADPEELGRVTVIVIPDIRMRSPASPFEPKASASLITEIRDYLRSRSPAEAEIQVQNARFVQVKLRFAVRFLPGCDPGFYRTSLNDELNRFLSPWAYGDGSDVVIGGRIYATAVIDFLERRPYVDYVAQLKLFRETEGGAFLEIPEPKPEATTQPDAQPAQGYFVDTEQQDSVLITAVQHQIDIIGETRFIEGHFRGIGFMEIGLDFKVA
ncbi:MAG: hypothetical protein FIA97_02035 [Methylococcaceae bacterium]|nr:hypothetical protein [Methylococcaceae bacterium]